MDRQKKAVLFGLGAVLLWSTVASAFKLSLAYLDHIQLLLYSSIMSTASLATVLAATGKLGLIRKASKKDLGQYALLGLLNPCLYYLVLFKAYDLLKAQEAQALNYTWAITLSLLAVPLLKQKLSLADMGAILLSYFGVVVIATHGDITGMRFESPTGVALALVSTIIWALYWIFNTRNTGDPVVGLFWSFLFGTGFILVPAFAFSSPFPVPLPGLAGAAYVGLFEMGLTFVLWMTAMKLTVSTARIANLIFLSPFLSLIFIHFLVGEKIYLSTLAGLGLIIAGNALQKLKK